jgi:uncharacterized protein
MNFDWDEAKNDENIRKHGLDFLDAWEIFTRPMLEYFDQRREYGEVRHVAIGILRKYIVTLVFTRREDDTIRVISLRRARKDERRKFIKHLKTIAD